MKEITLFLEQKNRVYFKCRDTNGFEVKLKITPKSSGLSLSKHLLLVSDISVKTKYGTDIIYELYEEIKKEDGICTLSHFMPNNDLSKKCKNFAGKWEPIQKVWVFPKCIEKEVEELDYRYNTNLITIEITYLKDWLVEKKGATFCGYKLCEAIGRDSGAKLSNNIILINGEIESTGSLKNWRTRIKEGTSFRLKISKNLLDIEPINEFLKIQILHATGE